MCIYFIICCSDITFDFSNHRQHIFFAICAEISAEDMQAVLNTELAGRIAEILKDVDAGCDDRNLIELPPPPYDTVLLAKYKDLILKLIAFRGIRNPKAFRDGFIAIDDSHDGSTRKYVSGND